MQTVSLAEQLATDGFAVLPNFVAPDAIAALRARAEEIVDAFDAEGTRAIFTTRDEGKTKSEDYFLSSGSTTRCFFEEEAFDDAGVLRVPKRLSINKIGHAMHDLDPVFEAFSHTPALAEVAREVGLVDARVYQSMYIFKQPHIGGEVRWHQDATYFLTDPVTVVTFWFALERADRTNGCLWVQRGGQRTPLRERFVVDAQGARAEVIDATPWPTTEEAEPVEVEAGTLVLLHGRLPHYSAPNRSDHSRHAYTLHAVNGRVPYAPTNWIQRDASLPVRGFTLDAVSA